MPTSFRNRVCLLFDSPSLATGANTSADFFVGDNSASLSLAIENPSLRNLTARILDEPLSLFGLTVVGSNNERRVVFALSPTGDLASVTENAIELTVEVSDNFIVCRPVGQPLRQGPCILSVPVVINIGRLICPSNRYIVQENGATTANVTFESAIFSPAFSRYLHQNGLASVPLVLSKANNSVFDVGQYQVLFLFLLVCMCACMFV